MITNPIVVLLLLFGAYWLLRRAMERYDSTEIGGCMVVFPWVIGLIGVILHFTGLMPICC